MSPTTALHTTESGKTTASALEDDTTRVESSLNVMTAASKHGPHSRAHSDWNADVDVSDVKHISTAESPDKRLPPRAPPRGMMTSASPGGLRQSAAGTPITLQLAGGDAEREASELKPAEIEGGVATPHTAAAPSYSLRPKRRRSLPGQPPGWWASGDHDDHVDDDGDAGAAAAADHDGDHDADENDHDDPDDGAAALLALAGSSR